MMHNEITEKHAAEVSRALAFTEDTSAFRQLREVTEAAHSMATLIQGVTPEDISDDNG